jgi:DNA-binding MarR family transcriptional regulator
VRTTADVAAQLGLDEPEAKRRLRALERDGLAECHLDESVNVPADFNREYWMLTSEGRALWDELDAERSE